MEESHVEPVESVAQDANMEETANELESKAEETEIDISESQVQNQEVKPDESSKGKALKIIKAIQYSISNKSQTNKTGSWVEFYIQYYGTFSRVFQEHLRKLKNRQRQLLLRTITSNDEDRNENLKKMNLSLYMKMVNIEFFLFFFYAF